MPRTCTPQPDAEFARALSFDPFDLFLIHVLIIVRTYRLPTLRAVKHLLARPDRFDLLRGWIPCA